MLTQRLPIPTTAALTLVDEHLDITAIGVDVYVVVLPVGIHTAIVSHRPVWCPDRLWIDGLLREEYTRAIAPGSAGSDCSLVRPAIGKATRLCSVQLTVSLAIVLVYTDPVLETITIKVGEVQ